MRLQAKDTEDGQQTSRAGGGAQMILPHSLRQKQPCPADTLISDFQVPGL